MGVVGNQLIFGVRSLEWGKMASLRRIRVAFCLDSFAIGGTELNAVRTAPDPESLFTSNRCPRNALRQTAAT